MLNFLHPYQHVDHSRDMLRTQDWGVRKVALSAAAEMATRGHRKALKAVQVGVDRVYIQYDYGRRRHEKEECDDM